MPTDIVIPKRRVRHQRRDRRVATRRAASGSSGMMCCSIRGPIKHSRWEVRAPFAGAVLQTSRKKATTVDIRAVVGASKSPATASAKAAPPLRREGLPLKISELRRRRKLRPLPVARSGQGHSQDCRYGPQPWPRKLAKNAGGSGQGHAARSWRRSRAGHQRCRRGYGSKHGRCRPRRTSPPSRPSHRSERGSQAAAPSTSEKSRHPASEGRTASGRGQHTVRDDHDVKDGD